MLGALGHEVQKLREVAPADAIDAEVWRLAGELDSVLITCNRDHFLPLAARPPHAGLIVLVRRRSRAHERAALVSLLDRAGEGGIRGNVNFARFRGGSGLAPTRPRSGEPVFDVKPAHAAKHPTSVVASATLFDRTERHI